MFEISKHPETRDQKPETINYFVAMDLKGKTALITGGSRGIGKAIAMRLAQEGVNIAIAAKTTTPHPRLEGTIYSSAEEIAATGVQVLPLACDIRNEEQIQEAVDKTVSTFGGIDILVNNASAINLTQTEGTEPKRFDLMHDIQIRGTFFMSRACIPHLKKSGHAHILNLSPPINLNPKWFGQHLAYTMSKYGMSMIVLGLAEELKSQKIGVNALWPKTTIATAAVQNLLGGDFLMQMSRTPQIVADAAFHILKQDPATCTGNFFIDEEVLEQAGITNLEQYAHKPGQQLMNDIFLD
jgi:citronellol/citronellal dehydrogenase